MSAGRINATVIDRRYSLTEREIRFDSRNVRRVHPRHFAQMPLTLGALG